MLCFLVLFALFWVSCAHWCLWVVHSWLPHRFSLTFIH
jgi:hypothetical protein